MAVLPDVLLSEFRSMQIYSTDFFQNHQKLTVAILDKHSQLLEIYRRFFKPQISNETKQDKNPKGSPSLEFNLPLQFQEQEEFLTLPKF